MKQNQLDFRRGRTLRRFAVMVCLLLLGFSGVRAQDRYEVTGVITDANAQPVVGASIVEKGTTRGTTSSTDGSYTFRVSSPDAVLVYSFFGCKTQEVAVANRTKIDIVLQEDAIALEEVVAIGYGTMKKSDLTGAVASVKSELLDNKPIASFDNALRGQIAGVQVRQNDGQPGGGASIRIRGTSSINGTNEPLYVIDGVPLISESVTEGQGLVINPLSSLSTNDIESIEVLKDASATAIYGARGANGVILVTTKRGREQAGEVRFSATLSLQTPEQAYDLLNGKQLAQLGKEAYENAGMPVPSYFENPESVVTRTNWMDEILRTAVTQNYQVNYSGGSKKVSYNFSAGYFNQEGILINTDFNRYTFRGQIAAEINKYIHFGSSVGYSQVKTTGYGNASTELNLMSMAYDMNPALSVRDADGNYTYRNNLDSSTGVYGGNPVQTAYEADMENRQNRFTGNIYTDFRFLGDDRLVFKTQFGVDDIFSLDRMYLPTTLAVSVDGPGKGNVASYDTKTWVWENTLTYKNTWGRHSLSAMVGQTAQKFSQNVFRLGVKNFEDDRLGYHDLSVGKDVWLDQTTDTEWSMLSYISRIHYSFDDRYLFTFTGRVDGSSKFGENNKYGFFPSGAFAWRVSEEKFMRDVKAVSNLKLRLSYGLVGNAGIQPYQSQGTLVPVAPPFGSGVANGGMAPLTLPNADLSWESTSQFDAGFDLGLFDNRLSITADYYYKYTSDLLYAVDLPMYSGYMFSMRNLGDLSNRGVEFSITAVPVTTRDFTWTSTFNIDSNVTTIEKLNIAEGESSGTGVTRLVVGDRLNNIWGYKTNGIAQLDEDLTQVAQLTNRPLVAGEQKYQDINNDGVINQDDEVVLGNLNPKFSFGFNNTFTYKNLSVNLFLEGNYGNDIINYTRKSLEAMDGRYNNITTVLDRWTPENPDAKLPRADRNSNSNAFSDRWVEDGSYLRIRDLTIGYTLPRNLLRGVASINVFVSFENLYTFTKYTGNDPSIGGGIDNNLYPTSRKYSLGVSLTF